MGLYRIVLGGQTECVKADGKQDVVALHSPFAAHDVDRRKGSGVTDVQSLTRRVRELDKSVKLRSRIAGNCGVRFGFFPIFLPFLFYCGKIVFHFYISLIIV